MNRPQWIERASEAWADLRTAMRLPHVTVNLMLDKSRGNHPFFAATTEKVYREYTRRHPRFPLIRFLEYGVAMMPLPANHEAWFAAIEGSARRNVRKAVKLGYRFERILYNDHLDDITAILRSTTERQGTMDAAFLERGAVAISDPESSDPHHDYAYYGVFDGDTVVAYAGCFVAGEILMIHTIFGHAGYQSNGVVPMLIDGIVNDLYGRYPQVKYFAYDKWFGASPSLRRFKQKFGLEPYRVTWRLQ